MNFLSEIPKIIHFYWDGSNMPQLCFLSAFTFSKLNPDWKIKIYNPIKRCTNKNWTTDEQKTQFNGKDFSSHLKNLSNCEIIIFDMESIGISNDISEIQKSDFLRWHLLSTEGGLWSDFDILYFRKISEINFQNQMLSFSDRPIDFSICYDLMIENDYKYSIGFLFAKQNCKFYDKIFKMAKNQFDQRDYQGAGSQILNKNYSNLIDLYETESDSNVWNISMDIVYAYNSLLVNEIYDTNDLIFFTQNSIGIHWYYGSIKSREFINIAENENQRHSLKNKNIIMTAMKKFQENINS